MNDFERTVKVYNINGKSFVNPDVDVTGSRFFIDRWKPGSVQLTDNSVYINIPLRINLLNQQVHFLLQKNEELAIPAQVIKEVIFSDSDNQKAKQYRFSCGFPAAIIKYKKFLPGIEHR